LTLVASLICIILFAPLVRQFNVALGFNLLVVPLFFTLLPGSILTPLTGLILRGKRAAVLTLVALVSCAIGTFATIKHTKQYPEEKQLFYVHKLGQDKAWWLSPNDEVERTTLNMFSAQAKRQQMTEVFGAQSSLSLKNCSGVKRPRHGRYNPRLSRCAATASRLAVGANWYCICRGHHKPRC
jgi:hypothetical protein